LPYNLDVTAVTLPYSLPVYAVEIVLKVAGSQKDFIGVIGLCWRSLTPAF